MDTDYQINSKDTNKTRKNSNPEKRSLRILCSDAVPSIFPNLPKHFDKATIV